MTRNSICTGFVRIRFYVRGDHRVYSLDGCQKVRKFKKIKYLLDTNVGSVGRKQNVAGSTIENNRTARI